MESSSVKKSIYLQTSVSSSNRHVILVVWEKPPSFLTLVQKRRGQVSRIDFFLKLGVMIGNTSKAIMNSVQAGLGIETNDSTNRRLLWALL